MLSRSKGTEATEMHPASDSHDGSDNEGKVKRGPPKCHQQTQTLFYLAGYNGMNLVEPVLSELGWKQTQDKTSEHCKFRWTECVTQSGFPTFKEGEHMVNHIPNCGMITNKLGLLMSLRDYQRRCVTLRNKAPALNMNEFYPETYIIDDKQEREAFFNSHTEGDIWINKPTGSNQGKGIFLVRDMDEFKQQLIERDAESRSNARGIKARIVQRYMQNPLLLEGRKFDIRSFMFIASTVPFLVCFHPGYIRLSIHPYSNEDTKLTTHLTNQYMQKKDPNYQSMKNDTVWSMEKFSDYIQEHYAQEHNLGNNWVKNVLNKQMQKIMMHIFQSVKSKIAGRIGIFELYGLDFMVDENFKIWLIEVNVNPAMHTNCDVLKQVLPPMIEEVIHISIECFEKARKGKALTPLASQKKFQILYNEGSSNNWTRTTPQNSLRFWVPPRFRSKSQSPTRNDDDSQVSSQSPSMSNANNQKPPFITSTSVPKFSALPRVATLQPRNFENTLRSYHKIEFNPNKKEVGKHDQFIRNGFPSDPDGDKRQPSPTKDNFLRSTNSYQQAEKSSEEKIISETQDTTDDKKTTNEVKGLSNSQNDENSKNNNSPSSPEPKKPPSAVRTSPAVILPKYRQRPTPVPREPAPVTRVQVLTGKAPDNPSPINNLAKSPINRYSPRFNKPNEINQRKRTTPLDRSS